jgi:hypothetical protein
MSVFKIQNTKTHRLISSRWPTIGVFDTVSDKTDAEALYELEGLTNDRLRLNPPPEIASGVSGAHIVMAAFMHPNEQGGRFNAPGRLGAWYAALELETAFAETIHHHEIRLSKSEAGFNARVQMRELISYPKCSLEDIRRQRPDLHHLSDYNASQKFGEALRDARADGIIYDSVRKRIGQNIVIYRPPLVPPVDQGDHYEYIWTGNRKPNIVKLTNVA